jgi:iron-regulated transporter 1
MSQFIGVLLGTVAVYLLWHFEAGKLASFTFTFTSIFIFLVGSGVLGSLGSSLMDIAIANDLAPSVIMGQELSKFNSRFRQIDLFTEFGSPVVAGLLLAFHSSVIPLSGFLVVAVWNLLSFFPEYGILNSIFKERPDLRTKVIEVSENVRRPIWEKLVSGWQSFFREPVAPAMIAYALLWLSVLSPHGVLLTGFLKDGWRVPEWAIGLFRGAGAIFGLIATVLFPIVARRFSLKRTSHIFLAFQCVTLLFGYYAFEMGTQAGQITFLVAILFSRIGLYGFSLGEMQIRQEGISAAVRGQVNGFANALTGIATLALFAVGAALPSTSDFKYLVFLSTWSVLIAMAVFSIWVRSESRRENW